MRKHKPGFTLIELVTAVIILGILAAIAAPIIMRDSNVKAACAEAVATMNIMRTVLTAYYKNYDAWPAIVFADENNPQWAANMDPEDFRRWFMGLTIDHLNGYYFGRECYFVSVDGTGMIMCVLYPPHWDLPVNSADPDDKKRVRYMGEGEGACLWMDIDDGEVHQNLFEKSGYPA